MDERDWAQLLSADSYVALGPRVLADDATDEEIDRAARVLMIYAQATRERITVAEADERTQMIKALRRVLAMMHGADGTPKTEKHAIAARVAQVFGQTPETQAWDRSLILALVIRCAESINRGTSAELQRRVEAGDPAVDDFLAAVGRPDAHEFVGPLYRLLGEAPDQEDALKKWAKRR